MRKACIAETGVDQKYINQSRDGNLPDVPELGCYILCLLEHCGMIDDDGTIKFDQVYHLLPESNAETAKYVTETCKTKRKHLKYHRSYSSQGIFPNILYENSFNFLCKTEIRDVEPLG